jgi:hypothetical protein
MSLRVIVVLPVVAFAILAFASCDDGSNPDEPCTGIPEGGCPLSHGVACDDPACEAAYACHPGNVWTLDHVCPAHEGGVDASEASADVEAAAPFDASIDAPPGAFGGPGCPSLEPPDCMLGFALSCPNGCCDCQDLYVCQNEGWTLWGSCSDDGGIHPN